MDLERKWLQPKKRVTANKKLRQAILDVLPFDVDPNKADEILWAILDSIMEGLIRDKSVTLDNIGLFKTYVRPPRVYPVGIKGNGKKYTGKLKMFPAKTKISFEMCKGLNKALRDEENNEQA